MSKAGAAGKAVRQSSGGVLSNAVAGGIAARLPGDGVLSKSVAGEEGCEAFQR